MVEKWINELERVRTSTNDAERSGRLKVLTTPKIIEKINEKSNRKIGAA